LPDPFTEYGHDPHAMAICSSQPNVLWQQNHCGVFRSIDGGDTWNDVTPEDSYGRYGFPITIDNDDPLKAWIIPAESDEQRFAKDQRLVVCHTTDGGETWTKQTTGLPQKDCFDLVFRHALSKKRTHMAFGTTSGNLFVSNDEGHMWDQITGFLPPIHSLIIF
jgi:photosystem II stability/assembly factor-like uncharacterized protein